MTDETGWRDDEGLRDKIAMKAMERLVKYTWLRAEPEASSRRLAVAAYQIADAMMEARQPPPTPKEKA